MLFALPLAYSIMVAVYLDTQNGAFQDCHTDQYHYEMDYNPMDSGRTRENNIIAAYRVCQKKYKDKEIETAVGKRLKQYKGNYPTKFSF